MSATHLAVSRSMGWSFLMRVRDHHLKARSKAFRRVPREMANAMAENSPANQGTGTVHERFSASSASSGAALAMSVRLQSQWAEKLLIAHAARYHSDSISHTGTQEM